MNTPLEPELASRPSLRLPADWLATVTLSFFALLLPVRADDPVPNANFPKDATISLGGPVTFQVSASTTNGPLTFQWQHEGTNLDGATLSSLRLTNVTELDAGGYQAIVWNAGGNSATSRLATLDVDPTFTQITTGELVTDPEGGYNATWIDYDNDGYVDVCVARGGDILAAYLLYHNNRDGSFTRIRTNAISQTAVWSYASWWGDYDNDGRVDLFVPNIGKAKDILWHNDGNGVFTKVLARLWPPAAPLPSAGIGATITGMGSLTSS